MFDRYRSLLAATRASYTPEKAEDERQSELLAYWLYRPLSFPLTPVFLAAGFSADGVTLLMFLIIAVLPIVAAWGGAHAYLLIVGLGLCLQVLDCVDGNVARVTRRFSPVGGMLDGLCTLLFWAIYFFTVGLLTQGDGSWVARHGREIGLGLAALFLAQREMEDTFDNCFSERVRTEPMAVDETVSAGLTGRQIAKSAEQILAFGGLALAGAFGWLPVFLGGLATYQVTVFALWLPRFVRAVLRRRRQ